MTKQKTNLLLILLIVGIIFLFGGNLFAIVGLVEPPSDPYQGGWKLTDLNTVDNLAMVYTTDFAFPENGFGFQNCFQSLALECKPSMMITNGVISTSSTKSGKTTIFPNKLFSDGSAYEPFIFGHLATPALPATRGVRIENTENLFGKESAFDFVADASTNPGTNFVIGLVEEPVCSFGIDVPSTQAMKKIDSIKLVKDAQDNTIYRMLVNNVERCRFKPNTGQIHIFARMWSKVGGANERLIIKNPRIFKQEVIETTVAIPEGTPEPTATPVIEPEKVIPSSSTQVTLFEPKQTFTERYGMILIGILVVAIGWLGLNMFGRRR